MRRSPLPPANDGEVDMETVAGGGGGGGGFEWDADSQLYFHASTGFYHDPVAGWYYSSRDCQFYMYENGNYVPWTSNTGDELEAYPCDEASQLLPEKTSGSEETAPSDKGEMQHPSEWLEETLINMYLSGYSNVEVNPGSSPRDLQTNEEDRSQTYFEEDNGNLTSDKSTVCLNDATLQQIEVERLTENVTNVHELSGEEEERWLSQYGQVERVNDGMPFFPTVDLWDWEMIIEPVSEGHPTARLVGHLVRCSSKLHPSLPARGGLLRTAAICEVHLDLVRVSSGKLYRLRNPSRKHLASLSAYDSSNPTKDWGFPDVYAQPENNLLERSAAQCQSEVADVSAIKGGLSAGVGKEPKVRAYRDRAAERRILHGGSGIGPGQKESTSSNFYENEETSQYSDAMGASAEDMNLPFNGLDCAKRIMESMGWKDGEALGRSRKGILEPIQAVGNKGNAGLGWNQTHQEL